MQYVCVWGLLLCLKLTLPDDGFQKTEQLTESVPCQEKVSLKTKHNCNHNAWIGLSMIQMVILVQKKGRGEVGELKTGNDTSIKAKF